MAYPAGFNQYNVNDRFMWGGSVLKMQWLPMPSSGLTANKTFDDNAIMLENGGAYSVRSTGYHSEFDMSWALREAQGAGGLDLYAKYASGYYSWVPATGGSYGEGDPNRTNYFYFANPMNFRSNLMAPQWATPMLSGQYAGAAGFRPIGNFVTWVGTAANSYDQPVNTVTFDITENDVIDKWGTYSGRSMVIPIPPTHTLWLGFSGSVTGAGSIGLTYHQVSDGSLQTSRVTDLLDATSSTRLDSTISIDGADADFVAIYVSSTGSAGTAGTVSLTSSMAQLWPIGVTPDFTGGESGNHISGEGNTGLAFTDSAMAETYIQVVNGENRHYKGLSTKLLEVEAWR